MKRSRLWGLVGLVVVVILLSLKNGRNQGPGDLERQSEQQRAGGQAGEKNAGLQSPSDRLTSDAAPARSTVLRNAARSSGDNHAFQANSSLGRDTTGLPALSATVPELNDALDPHTLLERTRRLVESLDEAPWDSSLPLFLDEVRLLVSNYASGRRYSEALTLLDRIEDRAKSAPEFSAFQEPLIEMRSSIETLREQYAALEAAQQTLSVFPDDADSHFAVGQWLILEQGNWNQAVVHLAKSGETNLWQAPAALELAAKPDARAIADAWWNLGTRLAHIDPFRSKLLLRSRYWDRLAAEAAGQESR